MTIPSFVHFAWSTGVLLIYTFLAWLSTGD